MEFKSLKNIESSFRQIRLFGIVFLSLCAVVTVWSVWNSYRFAEKQREKIYVLDNGKSLMLALSQDLSQNRPAEAREHVRRFHEMFFTLSPSTAYALPMAIASSSAAMIFKIMLHPSVGIINKIFHLDINWVSDPKYALICVAVLTAWLNSGINFLYFSAGLSNIDETIYERASVDGASSLQKFYRLTLPGLAPMMFYTLVVNIIQAFQSFGQVKILTQGGPGESTNLIVYSIYRDAFFNYRFGSAAAQSVVLFLIVLVLTLVMFKIEKKGVKY